MGLLGQEFRQKDATAEKVVFLLCHKPSAVSLHIHIQKCTAKSMTLETCSSVLDGSACVINYSKWLETQFYS